MQRFDEAFGGFLKLLEQSKSASDGSSTGVDSGALYNNLAVVQIRRSSSSGGAATYFLTKATEADPGNPDYMFNLGYAYLLERNQQGATTGCARPCGGNPTDADAHYVLAAALQASGSGLRPVARRELARQLSAALRGPRAAAGGRPAAGPPGLERIRHRAGPHGAAARTGDCQHRAARAARARDVPPRSRAPPVRTRAGPRRDGRTAPGRVPSPYEAQAHLLIGRIHLRAGRPHEAIDALKISIWSADTAAARVALAEAYLKTQGSRRRAHGSASARWCSTPHQRTPSVCSPRSSRPSRPHQTSRAQTENTRSVDQNLTRT